MAQSELNIIIKATDQASDDLKDVEKQAAKTGKAVSSLGKAAKIAGAALAGMAVAGVAVLAKTLYDSVDAAAEAQSIQARLNAVIRSTGGAAGLSARQINKMAESLSQVTRYEDDAIVAGQSLLLTFTNISEDIFPQATETMLDMSEALGQDLKSSAIQLGKALNDPIMGVTALQRVGVSFTQTQKDQIKTLVESGKLYEAQQIILKELKREFGGAARAAGETFAGKLDILKNSIGNVKEAMGESLLRPLSAVVDKMIEFANRPDIIQAARDFGAAMGRLGEKVLPPLIDGLSGVIQFGLRAMKTLGDLVDILGGTYQDKMTLNFFGQPEKDYVPSFAQRLSDAIRSGDWTSVTEAVTERGLSIGAEMLEGIKQGMTALPATIEASFTSLSDWVNSAEGKAAISGVGYTIADILLGSIAKKPEPASGGDVVWQWLLGAYEFKERWKSNIGQLGIDIGTSLIDGIIEYVTEEFWPRLLEALGLARKDEDLAAEGKKSGSAFADGVQTGLSSKEVYLPVILKASRLPYYGGQAAGYAEGGGFVVPPGYPDDSWLARFSSGELVMAFPKGKWPPGFQSGYYPAGYRPPAPSGGGPSIVNSPGATINYTAPGAGSMLGLPGLPGYQMQPGPGGGGQSSVGHGPTPEQLWNRAWPSQFMRYFGEGWKRVGIGWVDSAMAGFMNASTAIPGDIQSSIGDAFKKVWGNIGGGSALGSNIRRQFQDWMSDWFSVATTAPGETVASITQRMMDTAESYGGGIAQFISRYRDAIAAELAGGGGAVVGGAFGAIDKLMSMAGTFLSLGGAAATRYEEKVIRPMRERLVMLEAEGIDLREIIKLKKQIAQEEEKMLALQKQQQDLQWLSAQLDLIKLIKENGLDARTILGDMALGLGADPAAILQAMTRAMEDMLRAAQISFAGLGAIMVDSVPSWLVPGSPTPFEKGLRGIGRALDSLNITAPTGLQPAFAGGGGVYNVTVQYAPVFSAVDRREAEYKLRPLLESTIRKVVEGR